MTEKSVLIAITPNQGVLIEWLNSHPHSRIEIVTGDNGNPIQALVPTEDGLGRKSILFSDIAKKLNRA